MASSFGTWSGLWRSAFDADMYRQAAAGSLRRVFGYLAVLLAIAAVVITVQANILFNQSARRFSDSQWWAKNLPEIRIEQGRASSPVPQPFVYEQAAFAFVLDTTGGTTELDPKYRQGVLLTSTELFLRRQRRGEETRRYSLAEMPDVTINQATLQGWLNRLATWGWVPVLVIMTVWLWVAKLLQVLLWSLVGLIVSAVSKRRLSYGAVFRIGVVALTVPLYVDLIKDIFGWTGWIPMLLSLALYGAYLTWGVLVQPAPSSPAHMT